MSLPDHGGSICRSRNVFRLAMVLLAASTFACLDKAHTGDKPTPTEPNYFYEDDYDATVCPPSWHCTMLSAKQRQAVEAAIIQIMGDCPTLGNYLWNVEQFNDSAIMIHTTPPESLGGAWFWDSLTNKMSLANYIWNNTTSDSIYNTLRHEGYHGWANSHDEGLANLAETYCPS